MTRNEHKKYCVLEISLVYLVSCCPLSPHLISLLSSTSLIASSLNPVKLLLSCSHNRCKLMWFHIVSWHLHCAPLYFLLNERLNRALMKCRQWLELMAMTAQNTIQSQCERHNRQDFFSPSHVCLSVLLLPLSHPNTPPNVWPILPCCLLRTCPIITFLNVNKSLKIISVPSFFLLAPFMCSRFLSSVLGCNNSPWAHSLTDIKYLNTSEKDHWG